MTLSYGGNYAFTLLRWKGGLLRSLWKEMIVYFFVFFFARLMLQYGGRTTVHDGVVWPEYIRIFRNYVEKVPIHALVTVLAASTLFRWHKIVRQLNWPDYLMMMINANLPGDSKESRLKRHTAARYLALCQLLVYRDISMKVRRRFPRLIEVVNSGMMTFEEYTAFQKIPCKNVRWQLPLQWIIYNILLPLCKPSIPKSLSEPTTVALSQESLDQIIAELCAYRRSLYNIYLINWINFPFIYVQTAVCVTYGYFALCIIGHQSYGSSFLGYSDTLIPWLTFFQFAIYVGLLKMCQKLWRPFNDDHDDLELNYLLDRNAQTAMFASKRVPTPDFRTSNDDDDDVDDGWPTGSFWSELPKTKFTEKEAVRKNRQPKMYAAIEMEGKYGVELWERKAPGRAWQNLQVEYANDPDFAGPEIFDSTRRLSLHF